MPGESNGAKPFFYKTLMVLWLSLTCRKGFTFHTAVVCESFFFVILCLLQRIGSAGGRGRLCEGEEGGGRWVCGTRDGGCGGEGIMATAFSGYWENICTFDTIYEYFLLFRFWNMLLKHVPLQAGLSLVFTCRENPRRSGILRFADHPRFCRYIGYSPEVCPRFR